MSLDSLRRRVIFQNSIDVWIALMQDRNKKWNDTEGYKRFTSYLRENGLNMKTFSLCAHEAGATEQEKTDFVDLLAQEKDSNPDAATYTLKMTDHAMQVIKGF